MMAKDSDPCWQTCPPAPGGRRQAHWQSGRGQERSAPTVCHSGRGAGQHLPKSQPQRALRVVIQGMAHHMGNLPPPSVRFTKGSQLPAHSSLKPWTPTAEGASHFNRSPLRLRPRDTGSSRKPRRRELHSGLQAARGSPKPFPRQFSTAPPRPTQLPCPSSFCPFASADTPVSPISRASTALARRQCSLEASRPQPLLPCPRLASLLPTEHIERGRWGLPLHHPQAAPAHGLTRYSVSGDPGSPGDGSMVELSLAGNGHRSGSGQHHTQLGRGEMGSEGWAGQELGRGTQARTEHSPSPGTTKTVGRGLTPGACTEPDSGHGHPRPHVSSAQLPPQCSLLWAPPQPWPCAVQVQ